MPKPVCVPCQRFFRPKCNGVAVIENMPDTSKTAPGLAEPEHWRPYKLWRADLWHCLGCGAEIVVGFGHVPLAEHYQPDFDKWMARAAPLLPVNDC